MSEQVLTITTNPQKSVCCILLNFYIKPQRRAFFYRSLIVVSYWISTSNHNCGVSNIRFVKLYLIEFLHQTTTVYSLFWSQKRLYLIEFLHQTTTWYQEASYRHGCILLNFYIKPQRHGARRPLLRVVSYWISTSNHNIARQCLRRHQLYLIEFLHQTTTNSLFFDRKFTLYLIEFLHQTTTSPRTRACPLCCILLNFYIKPQPETHSTCWASGCILLNFYIKPQLVALKGREDIVVSYWISTSNHNSRQSKSGAGTLYLIEFLHQTTTDRCLRSAPMCCILLNFYIKPQQSHGANETGMVVSYWISTSNHNWSACHFCHREVVSYWISTSNHNRYAAACL